MDIKVGASGDIGISVSAAGDVVLAISDKEALSDQSVSLAVHPQVLGAALVKLLGGSAMAQLIVSDAIAGIVAVLPKEG